MGRPKKEVARMDEETASKVVTGDKPDESSILSASVEPKYKLNYRRPNGLIRSELSKAVIYNLNVRWPDLLRLIPSDKWVTIDEIVESIDRWERVSPRKSIVRTRETIIFGISELLEAGVLLRME